MKKIKYIFVFAAFILILNVSMPAYSQCSMCRAVAASGAADETMKVGRGLNNGILYLLAMPYILGGVAFFIWRNNRRKKLATQ